MLLHTFKTTVHALCKFKIQKCYPVMMGMLLLFTVFTQVIKADDLLKSAFCSPPPEARPGVYWYFMDGNLSREAMTDDLESMKAAGIGNLIFLEVNVGVPRGKVDFLSDQWQGLFKHAVREAERLGIEITLGSGPGWAGSGGPWVKLDQSMQHLVADTIDVKGPMHLNSVVPKPQPRKPFFGYSSMDEHMRTQHANFYKDVAVLAFPTPSGKKRIADIDEKALVYRAPYSSQSGVKPHIPTSADYPLLPPNVSVDPTKIVDLTDRLQPDGHIQWEVPPGNWTIMRFGVRSTGATTRPAPQPGLGFECDKLDAASFDAHFENYVGKLLKKVGPREKGRGWTMLHIDSWEMGAQNWTPQFREEFKRRRGYDPFLYLPTYTGRIVGNLELSERFLWDVRQTAQELVLENHAGRLKKLAHQHGFGLSIEPYDMNPTADLDLGGIADVPMCEFWSDGFGFNTAYSCFEATSIAHTLGRPVVAAESFTAFDTEAWKLYPGAIKNQGDWAFCTGINRFVYHTFTHKPNGQRPGMTMGPYGVHWDRGQTWWPMVSAYHNYVTCCQSVLRQGRTIADICYLAAEGAPHIFRPPLSALQGRDPILDRRGYNFDGCSPSVLMKLAKVRDGRIVFPGGAEYRLLVLPASQTMTPDLLEKIKTLIESGATVIGPAPQKSPSLVGYPECDKKVANLAQKIWGQMQPPSEMAHRKVGQGQIIWGGDLSTIPTEDAYELYPNYEATVQILKELGVQPDFETNGPLRYTHRKTQEADIYFVSNKTPTVVESTCTFRVSNRQPELWNPLDATMRDLPEYTETDERTTVPMRFEPHQSFFVVFRKKPNGQTSTTVASKNFYAWKSVGQITGPWKVSFDPDMKAPAEVSFATLEDWTKRPESGIKHYSGIATYRKEFDLPASIPVGSSIMLDLGTVHNLARIRLNGHELGVVWCAPWHIDITDAVQSKQNRLEIEVANLWPNRLIGDQALPKEQRVSRTNFNPYKPDSPLLPSGLLGPVTLKITDASEN
jgi:(4-O-methyl)-D-glucuronate---lignin esterase